MFIYGLVCPIKNIVNYVGQTCNLKIRLRSHLCDKRKSIKNNWIKSLRKRGLSPSIVIIEECDTSIINEREIYWIAEYRKINPRLKNMTKGGTGGNLYPGRPTKVFRSDGKEYQSIKEASIDNNINRASIFNCLRGGCLLAGGYGWSRDGITFSNDRERKQSFNAVKVYCSNGKSYDTILQASIELSIPATNIGKCISGKRPSAHGLLFWTDGTTPRKKKKMFTKPILCVTNNTKYSSSRDAARELNLSYKQISANLRGKQPSVHGYVFMFIKE